MLTAPSLICRRYASPKVAQFADAIKKISLKTGCEQIRSSAPTKIKMYGPNRGKMAMANGCGTWRTRRMIEGSTLM